MAKSTPAFTKDEVRDKIATSTLSVEKALVALYDFQTASEKALLSTEENNGVGFNGTDAFILSSFAEWVKKSYKPAGQRLSEKQLLIARKKLPKYAGQLIRIAEERMAKA